MLSRVNTLVNVGYGEELEGETRSSILIEKHGRRPIREAVW